MKITKCTECGLKFAQLKNKSQYKINKKCRNCRKIGEFKR